MRVATFVFGFALFALGGVSGASETLQGPSTYRAAAGFADGVVAPTAQFANNDRALSPSAMLYSRDGGTRSGVAGVMGFVPSQSSAGSLRGYSSFGDQRAPDASNQYDPARIPLPATRSLEDHLLTGFIALMLIAYQLRRKHRFLRPHQFST